MKLAKAKQKQLDEAYDTLIQVCLYDRPLADMELFLADDVMNFGAGRKELTKTKTAFLKQIKNQKKLASGLQMDFKINPVLRKIINKGDGAIYTDDIINTVWVNGVKNKLQFRLSFIFEYRDRKWIMVHSHTSTPDSQRSDDEVWPVEELKKRTAVLEKSLDEKIAELEIKNRELEIEAALERVRSRSMAMHQSAELSELAAVVFEQLKNLGLSVIRTWINIFNAESNATEVWITSLFEADAYPVKVLLPLDKNQLIIDLHDQWKQGAEYLEYSFIGEEAVQYNRVLRELTGDATMIPDNLLTDFPSYYIFEGCHKYGSVGVSSFEPVSKEIGEIVNRFAKVFEQTYTRFLDLQKAEAQAREAQIQLSLERVRARAMGMHHSDELSEVLSVLFDQFDVLGISPMYTFLSFIDLEKNNFTYRQTGRGGRRVVAQQVIDMDAMDVWKDVVEKWKAANYDTIETIYVPKGLVPETFEVYHEIYSALPEDAKVYPEDFPDGMYATIAASKFGHLGFDHSRPSTDEEKSILLRFNTEFVRLYQRFLDLQKAEEQAREATIEMSLERVRARSMAMHHSSDLQEVIKIVADQFVALKLKFDSASFGKVLPDGSWDLWIATPDQPYPAQVYFPYFDHKAFKQLNELFAKKIDFFTDQFTYEEKNSFFEYFFEHTAAKNIPEERKQYVLKGEGFARSIFILKNIMFTVAKYAVVPFTNEENAVFKRFAKVFEQTYTRFLDLQKAEAQAREALIEASLERVRAKAMAMHRSEELDEVLSILFDQFDILGVNPVSTHISLVDLEKNMFRYRETGRAGHRSMSEQIVDLDAMDIWKEAVEKWKKGDPLTVHLLHFPKEAIPQVWEVFNVTYSGMPDEAKITPEDYPDGIYVTEGYCKFGYIGMNQNRKATKEEEDIVLKFATEFGRLYQRFLDLQKAEAQAREAKIEAALEKVRSRTMAMQRSDELADVAQLLFQQVKDLGITAWTTGFNIWQSDNASYIDWITGPTGDFLEPYTVHLTGHPTFRAIREARLRGDDFFMSYLEGEQIIETYQLLSSFGDKGQFQKILDSGFPFPTRQFNHFVFGAQVSLMFITYEPCPEAHDMFKRFGKVFEQTYTRFLDLQKAEAQARESQIQLALERVRARTMAMHNSQDVTSATETMFDEFKNLGLDNLRCGVVNVHYNRTFDVFGTTHLSSGNKMTGFGLFGMDEHPIWQRWFENWINKEEVFIAYIAGQEKEEYFSVINSHSHYLPQQIINFPDSFFQAYHFEEGAVWAYSSQEHSESEKDIMKRFAKGFSLTFRRYQDLKKAEAQAREAQIEASLERVRARAMAMHKTNELLDAGELINKELSILGFASFNISYAFVDKEEKYGSYYGINIMDGKILPLPFVIPHTETDVMRSLLSSWKMREPFHMIELDEEATLNHLTYIGELFYQFITKNKIDIPFSAESLLEISPKSAVIYSFNFTHGYLFIMGEERLLADQEQIALRFTKVFELAYRRFLDLTQAEAQAKEAKIEAALEKVRSRSLAMHRSDELQEVVHAVIERLKELNVELYTVIIAVFSANSKDILWWLENKMNQMHSRILLKYADIAYLRDLFDARERGKELFVAYYAGKEKAEFYNYLFEHTDLKHTPEDQKKFLFENEFAAVSIALAKNTGIHITSYSKKSFSEEENDILKRFANVFDQAYTRFLDLQKAEAQAREAKIEAAMEKVRARAMAMQKPDELVEVAQLLRKEMGLLGVEELEGSAIFIHNETTGITECWYAIKDDQREKLGADHITMDLNETWVGRQMRQFYHSDNKQISIPMLGDHRKEWIHYFSERSSAMARFYDETIPDRIYHLYKFSNGYMGATSPGDISTESWGLLQRATTVFSLAYTRFSDLQIAEASAKEAVKQAALDRIRADIASMRTVADLDRITPLIWNELTVLGIPFIRCGVFIMDDPEQLIHTFLSTPDGKAIGAFHLPYDTPGNISQVIGHWRDKQNYIAHWDESAFTDMADILVKQGAIASVEQYLNTLPHGGFDLHFLPFLQGMLYVGNTTQLGDYEINLLKHVADAFSTAYARYEDFNKLEAAKQQVDKTLVDLKQAQVQLVQSEKMASLGELTAGIAHEIQNPLNFVNNFSDVSNELLEEMKGELATGNTQQAIEIAEDVIQNLEKILHHGKRADAIVKGMLQHSRTSSGQKELTDINILADEYLRLAYHGLRAKDKSFNAKFETDFDNSIGKINIIPQEVGRVILNLINNAFYAASLPSKGGFSDPKSNETPTVWLSTKKDDDKILISVKDNGPGIPNNIIDKIFQPFFTTKPTGQGTGLGLSLAYDIVKAHGGELKVETSEGKESEFIIRLPLI